MKSYTRTGFALLALGTLLWGCASDRKRGDGEHKATAPLPAATPVPARKFERIGTVVLVNREFGFVLIDAGSASPGPGIALKSFPSDVKPAATGETAIMKLSPERARPFVVADIVSGDPQKDDVVFKYNPKAAGGEN